MLPIAIVSIASTPVLIASAIISKTFSLITGIKPVDVSRESFITEMSNYVNESPTLSSEWVCGVKFMFYVDTQPYFRITHPLS